MDYTEGSIIAYYAFGNEYREVLVETKEDDVKNGQPGFDGTTTDGLNVWGYDSQIITVIRK
jgi:hypothetical protein